MKREAVSVDKNTHNTVIILVDIANAKEILPYLFSIGVKDEFDDIRELLKNNLRNKDKYCNCHVSNKAKNMYEMRFTRQQRNDRIYCQEISHRSTRMIIMVELLISKRSQDIPKAQKSRIETMGGYQYELQY